MTPYELEVLRIVAEGRGRFGWYNIERRLSNVQLEERGRLPDVLNELMVRGLVISTRNDSRDIYEITDAGRRCLPSEG